MPSAPISSRRARSRRPPGRRSRRHRPARTPHAAPRRSVPARARRPAPVQVRAVDPDRRRAERAGELADCQRPAAPAPGGTRSARSACRAPARRPRRRAARARLPLCQTISPAPVATDSWSGFQDGHPTLPGAGARAPWRDRRSRRSRRLHRAATAGAGGLGADHRGAVDLAPVRDDLAVDDAADRHAADRRALGRRLDHDGPACPSKRKRVATRSSAL